MSNSGWPVLLNVGLLFSFVFSRMDFQNLCFNLLASQYPRIMIKSFVAETVFDEVALNRLNLGLFAVPLNCCNYVYHEILMLSRMMIYSE